MAHISPMDVILVDNAQLVCAFFQGLFAINLIKHNQPCVYYVQKIGANDTIVLVESGSCDENICSKLSMTSVRHLFVIVDNFQELMLRATASGGQVTESKVDNDSGKSSCTIEGPEGIVVYISSLTRTGGIISPHEWLMSTIAAQSVEEEAIDDDVMSSSRRLSLPHARPIIHTLDVSLMSKKGFIPCPPNSRKATPFETDVRPY
jgi:predicted enzyme related to lactoylglutathione lyase